MTPKTRRRVRARQRKAAGRRNVPATDCSCGCDDCCPHVTSITVTFCDLPFVDVALPPLPAWGSPWPGQWPSFTIAVSEPVVDGDLATVSILPSYRMN